MPDVIRINNVPYSWNSSSTKIDNFPWPGILEISYGQKLDIKTVYSQTQDGTPIGGTAGQYSAGPITIKMLRDSYNALTDYLSLRAPLPGLGTGTPGSYGRTEFGLIAQVTDSFAIGAIPILLIASPCRIMEEKESQAVGVEELVSEVTLWCLKYSVNGKTLYSPKLGI